MKTSSAKAKGRNGQKAIVAKLLETFPQFTEQDIRSTSMGNQGEDIQLSQVALDLLGLVIESKNLAKIAAYNFIEQAKSHVNKLQPRSKRKLIPVAIVKQNRAKNHIVIIGLDDFLEIFKKSVDKTAE